MVKTQNLYLLIYYVVDDYVKKRDPFRDNHLGLVREYHDRGEFLLGGALSDPPDTAYIVFKDRQSAESFVKQDPYVKNGLVRGWQIREWITVVFD